MSNKTNFFKKNWFIIGLFISIVIGLNFPSIYIFLDSNGTTSYIITLLLFLIIGFTLPIKSIKNGMSKIKLHIYIQGFIFLIVPLYFYLLSRLFSNAFAGYLVYGLFALAVLPTTISTGVVFTQSSGGDTFTALFNSALANILGIFISPLLLSFFLSGTAASLSAHEINNVLTGLLWKMVLPILVGQIIRLSTRELYIEIKGKTSKFSSILILCMVLLTFSNVASDEVFMSSISSMFIPFVLLAISHIFLLLLAFLGSRILHFSEEDQISVVFVAPQKTMAMGVPLLSVYFASNPKILGYALLPLLFYHPWQLIIAGLIRGIIHSRGRKM